MSTITLTKKEYEKLVDAKLRYDYMRQVFSRDVFSPPPTRSVGTVMKEFKKINVYSKAFLKDLENGLRRSRYFRP